MHFILYAALIIFCVGFFLENKNNKNLIELRNEEYRKLYLAYSDLTHKFETLKVKLTIEKESEISQVKKELIPDSKEVAEIFKQIYNFKQIVGPIEYGATGPATHGLLLSHIEHLRTLAYNGHETLTGEGIYE